MLHKCFKCEKWFDNKELDEFACKLCDWHVCPICGACGCTLTPEERRVADSVYETYHPVLLALRKVTELYDADA